MSKNVMRTHIIVPKELVDSVDNMVGRRSRLRLAAAAKKAAGSLADVDIPGWETSESTAEWVRASREADENRLSHKPAKSL